MSKLNQFLLTVACGTAAVVAVAMFVKVAMRRAKKNSRVMSSFAWTLMFFSSGRMPPPPPASQIEQEDMQKKNREISRGDPDAT